MPYRQSLQGSPEVHLLQSCHDSLRQPQQQNELFLCLQVPENQSHQFFLQQGYMRRP